MNRNMSRKRALAISCTVVLLCMSIIVGTLVDVGRGRYTVEEFREIVDSRDLSRASSGVQPQGLFLSNVKYKGQMH